MERAFNPMTENLLEVKNLQISYPSSSLSEEMVVRQISFQIKQGEVVALVGESGSGKTQVSLSIIRLLSDEAKVSGEIILRDTGDLLSLTEKQMNKIRGKNISMIFQEPMTALNPVFTIGFQIVEALRAHKNYSKKEAREQALYLLKQVKIQNPEARLDEYPHELSGGMRQRVLIAIALASQPKLLIADEPTTALDVTTQAEILDLLRELQEKSKISILFITHDLGVVAELCDSVLVMYRGKIVEQGSVKAIFEKPSHPYTKLLMDSVPRLGEKLKPQERAPSFEKKSSKGGCVFFERCSLRDHDVCFSSEPQFKVLSAEHKSACFFPEKVGENRL